MARMFSCCDQISDCLQPSDYANDCCLIFCSVFLYSITIACLLAGICLGATGVDELLTNDEVPSSVYSMLAGAGVLAVAGIMSSITATILVCSKVFQGRCSRDEYMTIGTEPCWEGFCCTDC